MREHGGRYWAVQRSEPDKVWCLELSQAVPAPASWADIPDAVTHLPGRNLVVAVIPCEDPNAEATVDFMRSSEEISIPYEIMRWFMELVAEDVERCRAALAVSDSDSTVAVDEQ